MLSVSEGRPAGASCPPPPPRSASPADVQPFDAIHWGGYVSALSPFWMVTFDAGEGGAWRRRAALHGEPRSSPTPLARSPPAPLHRGLPATRAPRRAAACPDSQHQPACRVTPAPPPPPAEWASAAFVAMLSLGEAIWSPRW